MQTCSLCGERKDLAAFGFRDKLTALRHRACRSCVAAYSRRHYSATRAAYVARSKVYGRTRTRELQQHVAAHLNAHSCVDCGEADPRVLEFDHVDPVTKRDTIHAMVHQAVSWAALLAEIELCEVRCANCHRRRTAAQFGWAKLQFGRGA